MKSADVCAFQVSAKMEKTGHANAFPQWDAPLFACNLSDTVLCCLRCYQHPGRRFPRFFGGDLLLLPPIEREGVTGMNVTWDELFQFCMVIIAVIALVLQANNKEK